MLPLISSRDKDKISDILDSYYREKDLREKIGVVEDGVKANRVNFSSRNFSVARKVRSRSRGSLDETQVHALTFPFSL